jgi:uncharacterized protein (TIGR03437 family)
LKTLVVLLSTALGAALAGNAQMTVVNGASFDPAQPLAGGSFASMFGQNLCGNTAAGSWSGPGQLPTTLGGCSVTVGGTPSMLHYVSPGQINFIVPAGLGAGRMDVAVQTGTRAMSGTMMLGTAGPGMFAFNGMGAGEGAMLHGVTWQHGPFSTTTNGQPTPVSIFVTGLDLTAEPVVMVGGVPAEVTWYGTAPGYAGLQQVNITLPQEMAGTGRVPVTVSSNGQTSNVTFMHVLPTAAMMQGMPGWSAGSMMHDNTPRAHEMSYLGFNPSNNTALITDENDDVVRVLSLVSQATTATITLPAGSQAHSIAVNAAGSLAAVPLSGVNAVALIDLARNEVVSVIGTGYYPSRAVFSGNTLLVTNSGSDSVSVIDTSSRTVTQTVATGFGPSGIAADGDTAVVANMQAGSVSIISLANYTVTTVALPEGSRPHEVALADAANKAVITLPMANGFLLFDLTTKTTAMVDTGAWTAMGPGAVAVSGSTAYIANQMSASVTVADLSAGKVTRTFPVDPGPRALAVNASANQLLVLAEGTGTLDVVDLGSYAIISRLDAGSTERQGNWNLPAVTSMAPNTGAAGSTVNLIIEGSNLQSVTGIEFHLAGMGNGNGMGGMMGGGQGMGVEDQNIKVSNLQVSSDGTRIAATVQILAAASAGTRQIRLETDRAEVMGMMSNALFTITK